MPLIIKRKNGHYWIKKEGKWVVGLYLIGTWFIAGEKTGYVEEDIQEVDEIRLIKTIKKII